MTDRHHTHLQIEPFHVHLHGGEATERALTAILNLLEIIKNQGVEIMSAISDFSARMDAFFTKQDAAMADLQSDIDNLTAQIAALQNSAGAITAEDQALLDGIEAKAASVSSKLDALDNLTPPKAP